MAMGSSVFIKRKGNTPLLTAAYTVVNGFSKVPGSVIRKELI
jgi:hypothetical protein